MTPPNSPELWDAKNNSVFDKLAHSRFGHAAVTWAALCLGTAGLSTLTGCGEETRPEASEVVRVAKFSTLSDNASVELPQIPPLLEARQSLKKALGSVAVRTERVRAACESSAYPSPDDVREMRDAAAKASESFAKTQSASSFSAPSAAVDELGRALTTLSNFASPQGKEDAEKLRFINRPVTDWVVVLDRDVQQLERGQAASHVALLSERFEAVVPGLKTLAESASSPEWFGSHQEDVAKIKLDLQRVITAIDEKKDVNFFSTVKKDLSDSRTIFEDVQKTLGSENALNKNWQRDQVSGKSIGGSLATEAYHMARALSEDFQHELTQSLGVERRALAATPPAVTSTSVSSAHPHGHNTFFYYMYLNNQRSYGYQPYSGSRFTPGTIGNSSSWGSYHQSAASSAGVAGRTSGFSSHPSTSFSHTTGARASGGGGAHINSARVGGGTGGAHVSGGHVGGFGGAGRGVSVGG